MLPNAQHLRFKGNATPGMGGAKQEPFKIYTVEEGVNPTVYEVE